MKIVKSGKIALAGLCIMAMVTGATLPVLAASPAGAPPAAQLEACNGTEEDQVQAIRDAAAKVKVSYDEVDRCWNFCSPFQDKAGKKGICNTAPWLFTFDGSDGAYFEVDFTRFGDQLLGLDTVVIRAGDTRYSFECDPDYTNNGYLKDIKKYVESSNFELDDEEIGWLREMLGQEKVIVRFSGESGQQDYTWTAEDRQAITDMINLYDLLRAATPEVRAQALNG